MSEPSGIVEQRIVGPSPTGPSKAAVLIGNIWSALTPLIDGGWTFETAGSVTRPVSMTDGSGEPERFLALQFAKGNDVAEVRLGFDHDGGGARCCGYSVKVVRGEATAPELAGPGGLLPADGMNGSE